MFCLSPILYKAALHAACFGLLQAMLLLAAHQLTHPT
jgi:hypothetical protein